jgi:hypothetical protein
MAKILGCIKGDKVAAQAGIMQMNLAFFSGSDKDDLKRLARAANLSIVDVEAEVVGSSGGKGANELPLLPADDGPGHPP